MLGIEDLHEGATPYRGEPITVREVYEALAGSAVSVIATTHPGALPRILFDRRIRLQPPDPLDTAALSAWLDRAVQGRSLHRRVLDTLAPRTDGMDLFALCDALEADGAGTVFEPEVERALWDLEPVLGWSRVEMPADDGAPASKARVWRPFSAALAPAVAALGGEA